jgi:hypothetical protein
MGHTPEQRDKHALCGAKKKNGEPCRAFAGQKTDHPGIGKCWKHGGNSPSHKKHALAIEAQRQMIVLSEPVAQQPLESLLELHSRAVGQVAFAHSRIVKMSPEEYASAQGQLFLKMYTDERDRLGRIAEVCVKAGVQVKMLELQEAEAQQLTFFLDAVLDRLNLTEEQQHALPEAIDRALPLIEGEAREVLTTIA